MLSKFFLDRPVFAWVIAIIIMTLGALAIHQMPIAQYPPIAPPAIAIDAFFGPKRHAYACIFCGPPLIFYTILVGCCIDFAQESPQKLYFRSFVHWIPFAPCHDTFLLQRQPLQPFLPTINFQRVLK